MTYLVSIAPDHPNANSSPSEDWVNASKVQKSARRHRDFAFAGGGVLFEGYAGWAVDRDSMSELWVPATRWGTLQPSQHARFGICQVDDPTPGYQVTGWTIDRATPSVTLIEELIDPTDALPLVTEAMIDAALPNAIAEYVLRREWQDYDEAVEMRDAEIARISAFLKGKIADAGRRLDDATWLYLRQEANAALAASAYPIPPMPTAPSSPRP